VDVLGCDVAKSLNHFHSVAEYRFTSNDKLAVPEKHSGWREQTLDRTHDTAWRAGAPTEGGRWRRLPPG
jgi:hypothetical protein